VKSRQTKKAAEKDPQSKASAAGKTGTVTTMMHGNVSHRQLVGLHFRRAFFGYSPNFEIFSERGVGRLGHTIDPVGLTSDAGDVRCSPDADADAGAFTI
jgi:hypothetical protein